MSSDSPSIFPFNELPTELKCKIFIFDATTADDRTRVLALGAVCHDWRETVLSMPELWATVRVDFRTKKHSKKMFDLYMANSRDCPIAVTIITGGNLKDMGDEGSNLLTTLSLQGRRLKSLAIFLKDYKSIRMGFIQLAHRYLPVLEEVSIDHDDDSSDSILDINQDNIFCHSPRLRCLNLHRVTLNLHALDYCLKLTKIEFVSIHLELCLHAIESLTNLTEATFAYILGYGYSFPIRGRASPYENKSLSSLVMVVSQSHEGTNSFLVRTSCPSLTKLVVHKRPKEHEDLIFTGVSIFLSTSNCTLKELDLTAYAFIEDIWPVFDCVHTWVEILRLKSTIWTHKTDEDMLSLLVKKLSSPTYFPRVTAIYIDEQCGPLDYTTIYRSLQMRAENWPLETELRPKIFEMKLSVEEYTSVSESDETPVIPIDLLQVRVVSQEVVDEVIEGFKKLKERGMNVILKVDVRRLDPSSHSTGKTRCGGDKGARL